MSASQSVLDYINALKWPVVVAGFGIYLREPLRKLALRIANSPKGAITGPSGTGISWDDTVAAAEAAVAEQTPATKSIAPPPPPVPAPSPAPAMPGEAADDDVLPAEPKDVHTHAAAAGLWRRLASAGTSAPANAVSMAFSQVEDSLQQRARQAGIRAVGQQSAAALAESTGVPENLVRAISNLEQLDMAVYAGFAPDWRRAREFIDAAQQLDAAIRALSKPT